MHFGNKTLQRDDLDLVDGHSDEGVVGWGEGLKVVLIYFCPDATNPHHTQAL